MKKVLVNLSFVFAFMIITLSSFAGPWVPGVPFTSGKGQGAAVSHLATSYGSSIGGIWTLVEVKVINKNKSVENITGTITDLNSLPAGSYSVGAGWWQSDFDGTLAISFTFTVTANGDGTGTITGTATY